MNTSKSLNDILDTADWTKATPSGYLDGKALERKAAAKQAIVEAVEGLAPRKYTNAQVFNSATFYGYNKAIDDFLQAIKEWQ